MIPLHKQHCQTSSKPQLLTEEQINQNINEVLHWQYSQAESRIYRDYKFKNYHQTLAFINAVAWIVQQENHHPQITFDYDSCSIFFTTHSAGGITLFDFICAARIEQLLLTEDILL